VANEAAPYNELGKGLNRALEGGSRRLFLVFDQEFRSRYGMPGIPPDGEVPDWVLRGDTLEDLARAAGIDPAGLELEVASWNEASRTGEDVRFGRGVSAYDRYYGDPDLDTNPNFGPLNAAPYFAVEVYSGTIGSKGGPLTDAEGLAIRRDGSTITNLALVGNASVSWIDNAYPGPGATLSVGMITAFRAASILANRSAAE
jgi:3-oxosteroid 1-dehydrogenase